MKTFADCAKSFSDFNEAIGAILGSNRPLEFGDVQEIKSLQQMRDMSFERMRVLEARILVDALVYISADSNTPLHELGFQLDLNISSLMAAAETPC